MRLIWFGILGKLCLALESQLKTINMRSKIIILVISIFSLSCQQSVNVSDEKTEAAVVSTSSYSPPVFENDNRKEKFVTFNQLRGRMDIDGNAGKTLMHISLLFHFGENR